jgi:sialate O-acetylesterase
MWCGVSFLFAELTHYKLAESRKRWFPAQKAQLRTLGLRHKCMALRNDIGNPAGLPSTNKQDGLTRLALWGRYIAYGEKLVYTGPIFRQATAEGARMRVWFLGNDGGLRAKGDEALRGFELAGEDRRYFPADAKIDGNTVVVTSPSVPHPVLVRYAWATNPNTNLTNSEGPPASLFRSDEHN